MEKIMEKIVYDGDSRPHFESNFEIILNFVLRLLHKAVKGASSFAQRIFQPEPVKEKKHTYSEDL